jgi:hypothetical protein
MYIQIYKLFRLDHTWPKRILEAFLELQISKNIISTKSVPYISSVEAVLGCFDDLLTGYFIVGLFCYIYNFLLFMWVFFFTYALLAVVYVSHWLRIDFLTPLVCNMCD